jgi:hypothetical protein
VCLKWSNILLVVARSPRLKSLRRNSCYPENVTKILLNHIYFHKRNKLIDVNQRHKRKKYTRTQTKSFFSDDHIVVCIAKIICMYVNMECHEIRLIKVLLQ